MNKVPIAEGNIRGNLKFDQIYRVNYLPEETINDKFYSDKIEIAILMGQDKAYRSIRFVSPAELKGFVTGVCKAYFLFSKQRKEINVNNYRYKLTKFLEDVEKSVREQPKAKKKL